MGKIIAIGDIHGELALLKELIKSFEQVRENNEKFLVVFLGDYVDRGPDSRGVIETLMNGSQTGDEWICLKGNHEDMMVAADRLSNMRLWWSNGGAQTLQSYVPADDQGDPSALSYNLIPSTHLDWLISLPSLYQTENHIFVHAGLMPGFGVDEQTEDWLLWIRDRFLRAEKDFVGFKHIVHGHTPQHSFKMIIEEPELAGWRTNLDTGAFYSGVLTAGIFDSDQRTGPIGTISVSQSTNGRYDRSKNIQTNIYMNGIKI